MDKPVDRGLAVLRKHTPTKRPPRPIAVAPSGAGVVVTRTVPFTRLRWR